MRKVTIRVTIVDTETGEQASAQKTCTEFLIRNSPAPSIYFSDVLTAAQQGMEALTEE